MALYQKSVLTKYLKQQDSELVAKAFKKFTKYFHDPKIQQNIRERKEEQFQEGFLIELFVNVLGYTLAPNKNFNLTTEFKNEKNSKKADGAILKDDQALAVIELKGTNTKDLEKVRQQAFDYKANQTGCVYVITSNFEKIRFYINNAVDFEEFDLFNLNQKRFELLYLCLAKDNVLSNVPLRIKEASIQEEEAITKKFYADYSQFKRELFRDLVKLNMKNDVFRAELNNQDSDTASKNIKRTLFKKSQKLIDRFLFIFFAEDRGLLPPNSTLMILEQWNKLKDLDADVPLYNRFKKYFNYLDQGRKGTDKAAEIFAYNGGLFKADAVLDSLHISDELLHKHSKALSNYDFESQVDVNILGHIFENSLNEIESVNAEIEGAEFDKQKTKRKKDGVFYTPKYITKYIVDNTVGKLCAEKKAELKIVDEEFHPKRQKETKKKLLAVLDTYRAWLLQLSILDPACGSGAFLNQALDFLIKEHQHLDELQTSLLGGGLVFPNIETTVLENNIFGVDLNEESVEIAKLSLWLRTAQPRRKLNNLSSNIKCGNSLIDSKAVAGDKAFNWQNEFPNIFQKKEKKAWHVTTATHNSRYSQRMFDNHVVLGDAEWFDEKDEIIITQTVKDIALEDKLNILEYNICGDHMHILLVCEEDELAKIVGKLKSVSAKMRNRSRGYTVAGVAAATTTVATNTTTTTTTTTAVTRGHAPLSDIAESDTLSPDIAESESKTTRGETQHQVWTQKFGKTEIKDEEYLKNAKAYIRNNREKHELPKIKEIEKLKKEFLSSQDHAFRSEHKGGFDVVIGNPPYVSKSFNEIEKQYYHKNYSTAQYQLDLYISFMELGTMLLKKNGIISYIVPNSWLKNLMFDKCRLFVLENLSFNKIIPNLDNIFTDASVDTLIFIAFKSQIKNNAIDIGCFNNLEYIEKHAVDQSRFLANDKFIFDVEIAKEAEPIFTKINNNSTKLCDISSVTRGINPYDKYRGQDPEIIKNKLYHSDHAKDETFVPEIRGKHVNRYSLEWDDISYVSYGEWLAAPREPKFFEGDRIICRQVLGTNLNCTLVNIPFIIDQSVFIAKFDEEQSEVVNPKFVLAQLTSKLVAYYFRYKANEFDALFPKIKIGEYKNLPVNLNSPSKTELIDLTEKMIEMNISFNFMNKNFLKYLKYQYSIEQVPRKLQNWHDLDFSDFIKELNKAIKANKGTCPLGRTTDKPLDKKEEFEWMEVFETKKAEAQSLKAEIDKTDKEIDQMVYKLYDLTEEEIQIVENN